MRARVERVLAEPFAFIPDHHDDRPIGNRQRQWAQRQGGSRGVIPTTTSSRASSRRTSGHGSAFAYGIVNAAPIDVRMAFR